METKIAIVQFLFANNWKILSDSLGANPSLNAHAFHTSPDLMKFCAKEQNCLIIANVASKDDLIQLATFVKSSRRSLKNTVLKIVVFNATENKQFEKAIAKLGSIEILESSVSVKALRFKMDFWMKAMRGQAKKLGAMNQKSIEQTAQENAPELKSLIQNPPLECESDIWLLTKDSDCKRIIGRWMVKLMGPSPYVGLWNEIPNKQDVWTFTLKKAFAEQFVSGEGSWIFKGEQKPEYNWQENRWMFTGDGFDLFFLENGTALSKVKLSAKVLTIAGNSAFAKTKEALIIDSFNKDLIFRQEAELLKGQTLDFENQGDLGGNLEGKIKDKEQKSKGQLEGKFKEQELKKSNLHGKLKDKEASIGGHLEGEVNEQEESTGNLHGKVKEQEEKKGNLEGKLKDKEASLDGHLEGKLKDKEAAQAGNLEGEVNKKEAEKNNLKGKLKAEEIKSASQPEKKHEQLNEVIESNLKGKFGKESSREESESDEHKQHNEKLSNRWGGDVKQYTAEEKAERKRKEMEASARGPELKGKNDKTDHLDAHWGGKNSSEEIKTKGLSAPGASDVKEGSLLDLKNTENQHQTHYKNHNEAAKFEAGELGRHQYQEGAQGALGGKTSTDKLASHYGNGHKSEYKPGPGKNPLSGSSETDRLTKHLGRKNSEKSSEEQEEDDFPASALSGKSKTDKIKGHYGSGRKTGAPLEMPSNPELEAISLDLDSNVIPFAKPEEEKDIEKLTATASVHTYLIQNNKKHDCKLDDFFDSSVIFFCKDGNIRLNEKTELDISLDYQSENARINCEGVVMSIDEVGNGGFYVTVQVNTNDAQKFDHFMDIMKSRQENIQNFLSKAKGF